MSAIPTSITRSFATAGTIIASLALTGVASADELKVTQVSGNPTCADIDPSYTQVKLDNPRQGTTEFEGGFITIKGLYVDWSVTTAVDAFIVKGGDTANVYRSTSGDELTGGTAAHAPINDNGKPYGISHVQFCTNGVDFVPPAAGASSTPAGPCEPGGPTTMPDGQPCSPAPSAQMKGSGSEEPQGAVLGVTAKGGVPAGAQMSAPGACVKGSFVQLVRGTGIRRVTMFVNGKKVRTFNGSRSRYAVNVNPKTFGSVMRLKARVDFVEKSGKRSKTFRMTVLRCAQAAVEQAPAFAG